ncbi:MAG: 50S ribosomal protein L9 [Zetaproteobacteria bacterium]|nr:MAG: 50S ribosomal protein L9 [Zetaproteobacteria bacterium]
MQVILLERIEGLGNVGDVVDVRPGYARNYLIPQKKALLATSANRKLFERRRAMLEKAQAERLEQAKAQAEKMQALELVVHRPTSDGEHLYGSVGVADLAALLAEHGFEVRRADIILDAPIKTVGTHAFRVRLHPDVVAELSVRVETEGH